LLGIIVIEVRKLAAVDMAWLGARMVVTEYALGVMLPLVLGILSLRAGLAQQDLLNWKTILGTWLVTISVNYVPLFIYAVAIARAGTVQEEGLPEFAELCVTTFCTFQHEFSPQQASLYHEPSIESPNQSHDLSPRLPPSVSQWCSAISRCP
jgi:hypothetical protein